MMRRSLRRLNGSPIAYNENIRNSDQSGRQFQFRVIPADLISAIVVAKSPTADLIDGGIGSNIDVRTSHALDAEPFFICCMFVDFGLDVKSSTAVLPFLNDFSSEDLDGAVECDDQPEQETDEKAASDDAEEDDS